MDDNRVNFVLFDFHFRKGEGGEGVIQNQLEGFRFRSGLEADQFVTNRIRHTLLSQRETTPMLITVVSDTAWSSISTIIRTNLSGH